MQDKTKGITKARILLGNMGSYPNGNKEFSLDEKKIREYRDSRAKFYFHPEVIQAQREWITKNENKKIEKIS